MTVPCEMWMTHTTRPKSINMVYVIWHLLWLFPANFKYHSFRITPDLQAKQIWMCLVPSLFQPIRPSLHWGAIWGSSIILCLNMHWFQFHLLRILQNGMLSIPPIPKRLHYHSDYTSFYNARPSRCKHLLPLTYNETSQLCDAFLLKIDWRNY